MSSTDPPPESANAANSTPNASVSASTLQSNAQPSISPGLPSFSSQSIPLASNSSGPSADFGPFSATTAEILNRIRASNTGGVGTPAFEAKRAEVLQSYVTSDKLPTPPPIAGAGRRGRGGRVGTPSTLKTEVGANNTTPGSGATPTSARGSGRSRGRARGGRGSKGGKRKRSESLESDNDSDISSSYTPLPTRTKSGRNVNKPVAFVPTLPEPTQAVKRRRSTKQILSAQCKTCHRATDPGNNRIVFCDVCNTAYHQYCHDPPIDNEVVTVLEKEWLCGPCERSKRNVVAGTEGLVAGEGLGIDQKRSYLSTLPQQRLVTLLLHATIRHPELPLFPPDIDDFLVDESKKPAKYVPALSAPIPPNPIAKPVSVSSSQNGLGRNSNTPHNLGTANSSEVDPAEAQLLGEISRNNVQTPRNSTPKAVDATAQAMEVDEYDDGYDTDPPAHYPKAGNGLARTLRPESEDLQWLVDDNFEVFSHGWKGDGTGLGADSVLTGE